MTAQEVLSQSGCFDCLSPGVKETVMLGLLNSIEGNTANPPIPTGAATETTLLTLLTEADFNSRIPTLGPALRAASIAVALPTDQTPVPASLPDAALTSYTQAGVIAINTILVTLDLLAYGGVAFQCTSMGITGVVTAEWSIDNATWVTASINSQAGAVATTFSAAGLFNTVRQARYLRFRMSTATTGGTTTIQFERYVSLPCYWQATQPVSGTVGLSAGSGLAADVGTQYRATSTGAASGQHVVSAASTNATVVKNAAGRVVGWSLANTSAAWRYVKLHNQTTLPTAGAGVVRTIALAPNSVSNIHLDGGIAFTTGIGLTTVTGSADADNVAVGVGDIVGDLYFA